MLNEVTESYVIDGNLLLNCDQYHFPKGFDCGVELINGYFRNSLKRQLLRRAFMQAISVHRQIPIKGIFLDAAPGAVSFYRELGFQPLAKVDESSGTPMFLSIHALLATGDPPSGGRVRSDEA